MSTTKDADDPPPFHFPTPKSKLYEILGVSSSATQSEIKAAYREKAKKLHPDVVKNSKSDADSSEQNARFLELKNAYETLTGRSDENDDADKGPIFGPGMRARMDAAKKMREKHGQTGGRMRAAREWNNDDEENATSSASEKNREDGEKGNERMNDGGGSEEELSAAEILFRARQKRGKVGPSMTFSGRGGGRHQQQQQQHSTSNRLRRANARGGVGGTNAAVNMKPPIGFERSNSGNVRVKVLATIAVAGAVFLAANRKAKRREDKASTEH